MDTASEHWLMGDDGLFKGDCTRSDIRLRVFDILLSGCYVLSTVVCC
jgi:hypothetical protein